MLNKVTFRATLIALCTMLSAGAYAVADTPKPVDIPAGELSVALLKLSKQYGADLVYRPEQVHGLKTHGAHGSLTTEQAATQLLQGTPLELRTDPSGAMLIAPPTEGSAQGTTPTSESNGVRDARDDSKEAGKKSSQDFRVAQVDKGATGPQAMSDDQNSEKKKQEGLTEIVVTGTHIRGADPTSPVIAITQDQMLLQGQTALSDVVASIPQNFNGQNPAVNLGASNANFANQNFDGSSSFNLRGLGPDATLTLLNGRRLAYSSITQSVDVSTIPVGAIEKIEILLDGASAIYGSDAVAGVANIILKQDYDGLMLSGGYGGATQGGDSEQRYSAVGGERWETGGFLAAGDFQRNTAIYSDQRDYTAYMPSNNTLYPSIIQRSVLLTGHQSLSDNIEFKIDGLYSDRTNEQSNNFGYAYIPLHNETSSYSVSPTLQLKLPGSWSAMINGSLSRNDIHYDEPGFNPDGSPYSHSIGCYCNKATSAELDADGPLVSLPAGEARASLGVGYRSDSLYNPDSELGSPPTTISGSRHSYYGFAELLIPAISAEQHVAAISRLSINGAIRYENYSDLSGIATPKIGLLWSPVLGVDFSANWGRSFKAPTLLQEHSARGVFIFPANIAGVPTAPPDETAFLSLGGNTDLQPERASTFTIGSTIHPEIIEGLNLQISYFHIDYSDRVAQPTGNPFAEIGNPIYSQFITPNPTLAQQAAFIATAAPGQFFNEVGAYDPTKVLALANDYFLNIASQTVEGVDLAATYKFGLFHGTLTSTSYAGWLEGSERFTSESSDVQTVGTVYNPPHWRGRGGAVWSKGRISVGSYINYVGPVVNTQTMPYVHGGSQTTIDVLADYHMEKASALGDLDVNLAIRNLFDRNPPYLLPVPPIYPNYDSTNYSPIGRFIGLTLIKRW